ncbi:hypothetical protein FRB95_008168 [Tulasnella sp. JGI-2019a]|nr:hypothetical protein FRB95_008168 [Tulasnella sp. JGI-2019a]
MTINPVSTIVGILSLAAGQLAILLDNVLFEIRIRAQDSFYLLVGYLLPYRPKGKVIKPGRPGHAGMWPQYIPPSNTDSRGPCPGLNALANHGILPRNGRQVTFKMFMDAVTSSYNFAPTLAEVLTRSAQVFDQGRGYINLSDLNAQMVIQHDASFTRPDVAFWPDQSKPHHGLIDQFLSRSSDGKHLSLTDMAYEAGVRRKECSLTNGQYSLTGSLSHRFFGDGNAAFMWTTFGGKVDDLNIWLKEERFPDGWEPYCRYSYGHPMLPGELAGVLIEFNINEQQKLRSGDAFITSQETSTPAFTSKRK